MILTIDPKNPKKLRGLAGYLGEVSVIFARIKGQEKKGIAKVGIWIETPVWVEWQRYSGFPVERSIEQYAEPEKWDYADTQGEGVHVNVVWSWPDEESDEPTFAEGVTYEGDDLVGYLDEDDGWHEYDESVDAWRVSGQPKYLEDMTRFWGLEGIDLDLSDVAAFLKAQGAEPR